MLEAILDGNMSEVMGILAVVQSLGLLFGFVGLIMTLAPYFFFGYMYYCCGSKAGLSSDKGWMPFIPIAREIYRCYIADVPVWYMLFFIASPVWCLISLLIFLIFGAGLKLVVLAIVLIIIYTVASLVFTYFYFKKFYGKFDFNENTAWIELLPVFAIVSTVLLALIAFDSRIQLAGKKKDTPPQLATVTGIAGSYTGAVFDISNGEPIIFGRNAQFCNVLYDNSHDKISGRHCTVRFDPSNGKYYLTDDRSTNGVYFADGRKLGPSVPTLVAPGTVFYLGQGKAEGFRIG